MLRLTLTLILAQIRLGEQGWKERYYREKFNCVTPEETESLKAEVVSLGIIKLKFGHNTTFCPFGLILGSKVCGRTLLGDEILLSWSLLLELVSHQILQPSDVFSSLQSN